RPWDLVFVVFMSILTTGIGMFLPYLTKTLTGDVVSNKSYSLYLNITIFLIVTGVVYILIKATQSFVNARVAIRIEKLMTETTMRRMLSLPPSFFRQYSTGELAARFSSVSHLSSLLFNGVFLTLLSSIMSLAFFAQIVQFTPALVVPVILILTLSTGFTILISLLQVKVSRKQLLLSAKESGSSYQMISGIQKIRLAGAEKRAFAIWAKDYAMASEPLYHPPLLIRLSPAISTFLTLAGEILIYFIASKNGVEASSYLAFTASFASLSAACAVLAQISDSLSRVRPVLDMARPILEAEAEDEEGKQKVESLQGNIKLEHVSFAYQQESRTILQDIDIEVKEGEYIGVVGKTGCGKSTLIRLLLGFEKPTSGKIYFDGKDMDTLNLQSLRSKIGSVTQNGGVFHADILSNILITAPQLGEKDAWEAARIAGIADDINAMPMKMNTVISEGQGGISGGQRQRIMIARAIVNKPKVLLFDEATSALDNRCQKKITEALSSFHCTRIVIAHRLSTIKDCDRILYMEDGKILEQGTYEELVALGGKFAELIERQKLN
ncbi:MAG: ATP-binding cassette domain-containing protein, partial [Bacilli bacterium]|nr:ATP-binding cassette domain-containing protein [Bacilli bacterium]